MLAYDIINMEFFIFYFFYQIMNDTKHTNTKFYVNIAIKKKWRSRIFFLKSFYSYTELW